MALRPVTRLLCPYEVIGSLGAGGVRAYRARDTRLERDIAPEILPQGSDREDVILEALAQRVRAQ